MYDVLLYTSTLFLFIAMEKFGELKYFDELRFTFKDRLIQFA